MTRIQNYVEYAQIKKFTHSASDDPAARTELSCPACCGQIFQQSPGRRSNPVLFLASRGCQRLPQNRGVIKSHCHCRKKTTGRTWQPFVSSHFKSIDIYLSIYIYIFIYIYIYVYIYVYYILYYYYYFYIYIYIQDFLEERICRALGGAGLGGVSNPATLNRYFWVNSLANVHWNTCQDAM